MSLGSNATQNRNWNQFGTLGLADSFRCETILNPSPSGNIGMLASFRRQPAALLELEKPRKKNHRTTELLLMGLMLTIITCVSMIDVYWSFKTQAVLAETEQNPIGKWLIDRDGGDISLFMTLKMAGTMFVILAIPALYSIRRQWGLVAAATLTVFQCLLLVYFYVGHQLFPAAF
ncbi:MAG: hypothetical protein ACR2NP_21690 [Pirellulaceae bacterium]